MRRRLLSLSLAAGVLLAALPLVLDLSPSGAAETAAGPDPLAALGHEVSSGAAPGYVDSSLCGLCHQELYQSYQAVGMARSFFAAERVVSGERRIEDFAAEPYFHEPSRRFYQISLGAGGEGDEPGLVFRRWQEDADGERRNELDIPIAWVLGSGNHSRVYLYRTPTGELFQLPLAWYTQAPRPGRSGSGAWRMSPGFDRPDHEGVHRRARRECMFCHNGYPDVPEEADDFHAEHTYPAELPEGTGCQRCHGPGAEHVRRALSRDTPAEGIRAAIVNPGKLEPELRDSVCYECHMEPSVAFPGIRRFGRGDYSFRPGERLADFRVELDIEEEGRAPGDRFEINHHPYRLEQSPCFVESRRPGADLPEGAEPLSCLTCHDPHVKVPPERRIEHYRAACASCHGADACGFDHAAERPPHLAAVSPADCTACHMPARRPEDVVHVVMTDHRITRELPGPELVAPRAEKDPVITALVFHHPEDAPAGAAGQVYRAVAALRSGAGGAAAVDALARNLEAAAALDGPDRIETVEPWLELAKGQLGLGRTEDALRTLGRVLSRDDLSPGARRLAREWLALAQARLGKTEEAIDLLEAVLEDDPNRLEPRYNLARLLYRTGEAERALEELEHLVAIRPNHLAAWRSLGEIRAALGRHAEAADAYRTALSWEPADPAAAEGLAAAEAALQAPAR